MAQATSLAVWDVPMPVVAGGTFQVKAGAKAADGRALAGCRVEVFDATGAVVASGTLGDTPWAGTEALYWTAIDVRAPAEPQVAEYSVRCEQATARFSVAAAGKPGHTLTVQVTEQNTKAALEGVEIRLGPFHARTDKAGRAELRVCPGGYRLHMWRAGHMAQPRPIEIAGDASVELTMLHVPEEHPDARWVR